MKRSQINALIENAKKFFSDHSFVLPPWAFWSPEAWKGKESVCSEIRDNMLGWDLTDFGSGDFDGLGLLLFTIRNGNMARDRKPYAEKIMLVQENQVTPMHFHWNKMEDIINRGGGNLMIQLYLATADDQLSDESFTVKTDGMVREVKGGDIVTLTPGESITLEQRVYHKFWGEPGKGTVLVGEVSQVNDDTSDNRFHEKMGRFPEIEEDEAPLHLLVSDYPKYF